MTTMNGAADDNNNNNERDNPQPQPQIDDAKNFLERVKEAFKNEKGVYDRFVEIMKNFKHDRLNTGGVIKEVQELFSGHNELFIGFQNFLPAAGLVTQDELRQTMQNMNDNAPNTRGNGHNNSVAMTPMGPNDQTNNAPPDFNMAVTFICKIKQRFGSHRRIYQEFLQILQHFQTAAQANDTSVIKDVKMRIRALFRDHPDLLDQFDYFLPPLTAHFSRNNASTNTVSLSNNVGDGSDRANGRNSRKRRADSDLDNQPDTKRRRQDHESLTADKDNNGDTRDSRRRKRKRRRVCLDDDDDDDDSITFSDLDVDIKKKSVVVSSPHDGLRIFSKLRRDIPDDLYKHVLTLTQLYPMGLTEFSVVGKLICDALREHGHSSLMREFQSELGRSKQSWFFRSRGQNYYEYLTSNSLLSSCRAVQSSYRELPSDVVQPRCSGRHPDAAAHLNDYYVSKPRGGEGNMNDESSNNASRLKSIYSDNLQKSEDDLFELDMMISTNDAARKRLEQLYKTVMAPNIMASSISIPPVERRAISRLYSEHGNKVLNLLKKMPETTIPVVLKRLREKSNEWISLKNEMKIVWKSVAAKNYYKAHDFRYTIFKQYDTKRMQMKSIMNLIYNNHLQRTRNKEYIYNDVVSAANGVVSGVGLIGNASHHHILEEMAKGLKCEQGLSNDNDYRAIINNCDTISHCARFIFEFANNELQNNAQLFAKILQNIFINFFNYNCTFVHYNDTSIISQIIDNDTATNADYVCILGNTRIYALFRYLHCLYSRINYAKKLCKEENPLYRKEDTEQEIENKYNVFLSTTQKLIKQEIQEEIFEDELRKLLGVKSYQLFTINRVLRYIYNQICQFDNDNKLQELYKLFLYFKQKENKNKYKMMAHEIIRDSNQDLYEIKIDKKQGIMTIDLLDKPPQISQNNINNNQK